jgi:GABA(A) receptor-associated protein
MDLLNTTLSLVNGAVSLSHTTTNLVSKIPNQFITESSNINFDKITITPKQLMIMKNKYPNKVPIVIQKSKSSKLIDLPKNKYLIDRELPVSQFKYLIQKKLNIGIYQALFIFNEFYIVNSACSVGDVYDKCKSTDEILYLSYCEENAFG